MKHRITEAQLRKLVYSQVKKLLNEQPPLPTRPTQGTSKPMQGTSVNREAEEEKEDEEKRRKNREKRLVDALKNVIGPDMGSALAYALAKVPDLAAAAASETSLKTALFNDQKIKNTFTEIGYATVTGTTVKGEAIDASRFQQAMNIVKQIATEEKQAQLKKKEEQQ